MPYIDTTYYTDEFKGLEVEDVNELNRMISRASDYIDQITNYKLKSIDFSTIDPFFQEQVKKAVCAQVEAWQRNGGLDESFDQPNNVSVGKFSYSQGRNADNANRKRHVDQAVLEYLKPTGLLYSGIGVVSRAY